MDESEGEEEYGSSEGDVLRGYGGSSGGPGQGRKNKKKRMRDYSSSQKMKRRGENGDIEGEDDNMATNDIRKQRKRTELVSRERVWMECAMHKENARIFASGIQCLAKVGKELIIEVRYGETGEAEMVIRAMNDSKTAFTVFRFSNSFFERLTLPSDMNGSISAKFPLKSCLCAFRSIRNVERFQISFAKIGPRHVISFTGYCKGGLVKTHELHYQDTEIYDANFDRRQARNKLCAHTAFFINVLGHLQGVEEVVFTVGKSKGIRVNSFYQHVDQSTTTSVLQTNISLGSSDLNVFEVNSNSEEEVELTFGIREFKALLGFCETAKIPSMALFYNGPGEPFLFTSDHNLSTTCMTEESQADSIAHLGQQFTVELIMATLVTEEHDEVEQEQSSVAGNTNQSEMTHEDGNNSQDEEDDG